jgi:hypothetical protein
LAKAKVGGGLAAKSKRQGLEETRIEESPTVVD